MKNVVREDHEKAALRDLQKIPGVGKAVARDLLNLGYSSVESLKGRNPEIMYLRHNDQRGQVQDICMLYTFRCAVYFAETPESAREAKKLNWWFWMDAEKVDSLCKDRELRKKWEND